MSCSAILSILQCPFHRSNKERATDLFGLPVEVIEIGKAPCGEEIGLEGEEVPFLARFAVRLSDPVRLPGKAVAPREGSHLGIHYRPLPGSIQHR